MPFAHRHRAPCGTTWRARPRLPRHGNTDLVVEQERMGMKVPGRTHDTAREIKLDVVDAIFDLLADGFDPPVGAIDLQRMTRGQEVPARGGEEITAGE